MQAINRKIEFILPIFEPLPTHDIFGGLIDKVIRELTSHQFLFPLDADQLLTNQIEVTFELLDENNDIISPLRRIGRGRLFLLAHAVLEIIDKPIEGSETWSAPTIDLWTDLSVSHLTKRIYDFIISVNIACVGSVEIDRGLVYVDGILYKQTEMLINDFKEVFIFTKKTKWPTLEHLEIRDVWEWITKNKGFLDGIGGSPIDRALTALTHLYGSGNSNEGMDLFFTMIGLEALYCSSNNGVKEQLVEKAQVFLGTQNEYKKLFKGMYDYRSKFIHGGLNFPGKYYIFDGSDEFDKYLRESYEVTLMAQSVLIATIQQLSKRQMSKLEYKYSLVNG